MIHAALPAAFCLTLRALMVVLSMWALAGCAGAGEQGATNGESMGRGETHFTDREFDMIILPILPQELKQRLQNYLYKNIGLMDRDLTPLDVDNLSRIGASKMHRYAVLVICLDRLEKNPQPDQIHKIDAIFRSIIQGSRRFELAMMHRTLSLIEDSGYFERARKGGGHLDEGLWTAFQELESIRSRFAELHSQLSRAIDQPQQDR